jgi:ubiquinone biosynthesis protein
VLTLERLQDRKVYDAIENGWSGEAIAKVSLQVIIKQIFEDGFFHADPHPGNLFILGDKDNPHLGMIDLGLVGRLTPKLRDKTIDLMVAAVRQDSAALADALFAIGKAKRKIDKDEFESEVAFLADKYLGRKLGDIEISGLISDLVYGGQKYGLEIPADFLMVGKTLMTVEGVGKEIYPELDVFAEVKPFFLGLLKERYSPERLGSDLLRVASRLGSASTDLPLHAQEVLDDLRQGSFQLNIQEKNHGQAMDYLGRRIFSGFVIGALFLGGLQLLAAEQFLVGGITLAIGCGWLSAHSGAVWLSRRFGRRDE